MKREAYEISELAERDEHWHNRGDYLSGVAQDYYYATHPSKRPYPMTKEEVKIAIELYKSMEGE